ncbi:hypothetical protein JTB14_016091 [Gonioctena quinquepunctata]|nr:hypothetical protein JTB14_016091 [Gonioctena quinquepunctata]
MLKNGFRACGLLPLDPDALDYFKMKNKEDNASISKSPKNVEDIKNHLTYIESLIPQDKLKLFEESGPTWLHEMEFTELFKIWHKINTSISGEDTETALEILRVL